MQLTTAIGTVCFETDWPALLHFMEARQSDTPALEKREVTVRVALVDRSEIAILPNDPPDTYPRRVYVENAEFTLWRDRIEGRVPKDIVQVGLLVEWIFYVLAVCCAPEGWECVHSAAVENDKGVCLIFGESGTGKTRCAIDMMNAGWRYFADDIALVNAEGTVARGWDNTMHVDPRAAKAMGRDSLTLDFCGKVRIPPPAKGVRTQAPIVEVLLTGGQPPTTHNGPGFDSAWVNNYGAGEKLLAAATAIEVWPEPVDDPDGLWLADGKERYGPDYGG